VLTQKASTVSRNVLQWLPPKKLKLVNEAMAERNEQYPKVPL
jgi:hypothetical protein